MPQHSFLKTSKAYDTSYAQGNSITYTPTPSVEERQFWSQSQYNETKPFGMNLASTTLTTYVEKPSACIHNCTYHAKDILCKSRPIKLDTSTRLPSSYNQTALNEAPSNSAFAENNHNLNVTLPFVRDPAKRFTTEKVKTQRYVKDIKPVGWF
ncbi:hypothetical protein SS50377_21823 [Spironucleus salmonicida]|uniref:Uncharacterized protein n=1 Tax=Spironucleus salmonicida TaxID=348837 RepID=V6LJM0_9EUKA|nr:hypothetical protein SS50377_21823 [Spironucleus salmonicida]|eukprot:EST44790.1 Hypothetical protein SS50377_15298 [Spironucleus salmonicida]